MNDPAPKPGKHKLMGLHILGESPEILLDSILETEEKIARYDLVTFEQIAPGRVLLRTVRPSEYAKFQGLLYQIDRGEMEGTLRLRQMKMAFFPLEESEG